MEAPGQTNSINISRAGTLLVCLSAWLLLRSLEYCHVNTFQTLVTGLQTLETISDLPLRAWLVILHRDNSLVGQT